MKTPISAYQETNGMIYFARMLDKIRKFQNSELREDFHDNLGKGLDGRCVNLLRVRYEDLVNRTIEGGTDQEILQWCFENGRELNQEDIFIWNQFTRKIGWQDPASDLLRQRKEESGLAEREDILTMLEYFEYDEGRK